MKPVTLKKVKQDEAVELQAMVLRYSDRQAMNLNPQMSLLYFDTILQLDIMKRLVLIFRNKIESPASKFTLSLKPSEAVVLLYSCQYGYDDAPENIYTRTIAEKFKNEIDQQLKSLIIRTQSTPYSINLLY